jgi:hypothetical protein
MSVTPGYNDWRLDRQLQIGPYLPRLGGRTFVQQWRRAFEVNAQVALVYSYNEYFEQTQIEPTVEQGDRYLLLNQLLARRFKDRRSLSDAEVERLADVIEPPAKSNEEKVAWLAIDDPRITRRGLQSVGEGRAELHEQAELDFEVDSEHAFIIGIAHAPSFDRCAGFTVSVAGDGPAKNATFATRLTQLAILRDIPQKKTVKHLKLLLRRTPANADCRDGGSKPIVITGVTRYASATDERQSYPVDHPEVTLDNFWDMEQTPHGAFAWTRARSSVAVGGLMPGARYHVSLVFRDIVNLSEVSLGPDVDHMRPVPITVFKRTAAFPDPLSVSQDGKLYVSIETPTWRPSKAYGSEDRRALGVALTHVTIDRVE